MPHFFFKTCMIFSYSQKFTEGYCKYDGDLLENLSNITSASACQFACLIYDKVPACNYFFYNGAEENCQFLSSTSRSCDLIRGPPNPSIQDCSSEPGTVQRIAVLPKLVLCTKQPKFTMLFYYIKMPASSNS